MNPVFIIFLFAMSLLAIAAACALLFFIANELRLARIAGPEKEEAAVDAAKAVEAPTLILSAETGEVSEFLSKMKAATLIGASRPQKRIDDQDVN